MFGQCKIIAPLGVHLKIVYIYVFVAHHSKEKKIVEKIIYVLVLRPGNFKADMEIPDSRPLIFYSSRIFGLAPYLVKRNDKGVVVDYKLSVLLCVYSVFVILSNGKSLGPKLKSIICANH